MKPARSSRRRYEEFVRTYRQRRLDDLILLMDEGRVIERGTHDGLMAAQGTYYRMVRRQMDTHGEPVEPVLG